MRLISRSGNKGFLLVCFEHCGVFQIESLTPFDQFTKEGFDLVSVD